MRIVFFGTPQFAVPTLDRLLEHPEFEVVAVVTQPDKRRGRGSQLIPSPVKERAIAHQIPVWQPTRIKKNADTLQQLRETQADAFVVVAYGQILSPEILAMPRLGCINVHGSLLPEYRGAAPIQWCLRHGATVTGITTMQMDAGMDTGPMLLKATVPIGLFDSAADLAQSLANVGADLLIETLLERDRGALMPEPQDDAQATYAPLIQKSDYELDWSQPAIALHNQVRGFYPACVTTFRAAPLKVMATAPISAATLPQLPDALQAQASSLTDLAGQPGEVVALLKNLGPVIQTGDGLLLLQQVQMAGKRPQSGWDFANGARLTLGETLGV